MWLCIPYRNLFSKSPIQKIGKIILFFKVPIDVQFSTAGKSLHWGTVTLSHLSINSSLSCSVQFKIVFIVNSLVQGTFKEYGSHGYSNITCYNRIHCIQSCYLSWWLWALHTLVVTYVQTNHTHSWLTGIVTFPVSHSKWFLVYIQEIQWQPFMFTPNLKRRKLKDATNLRLHFWFRKLEIFPLVWH